VLTLGLGDALGPFFARTLSDRLDLVALTLLLFSAWWALRALADRSARVTFLVCGGAFVGSLAARSLTLPFLLLVLMLVSRVVIRRPPGGRVCAALAGIGALVLVVAARLPAKVEPLVGEADPARETRAAIARGNLFEARLWAERWATGGVDGARGADDPALLLAEIDWNLGHHERARSIAADVAAHASDAELRRRAAERVIQWSEAR
jgi:hypothetical protein